ncbi:MAG: hypothetical protein O9296_05700 [Novosphingobium sp.]|nr:hypothetical protein [Novosphingobium sp.]
MPVAAPPLTLARLTMAFAAGALAVLLFHQVAVLLIARAGVAPLRAFVFDPVAPFGIPQVMSLAFFGGLWAVVFTVMWTRFGSAIRLPLWAAAAIFGAVAPTLVAWFVVAPLKGQPVAAGFNPARMWIGPVLNGLFGIGFGLLIHAGTKLWGEQRSGTSSPTAFGD